MWTTIFLVSSWIDHPAVGVTSVVGSCPCGRADVRAKSLPYSACCGRYLDHFDAAPAPDAASLMRSRYTAFVLERADYLLATWHQSHRPASLRFEANTRWLGLDVRAQRVVDAEHAEVEFVARSRDASGRASRLHERSRFVREPGSAAGILRWYYLDGQLL